MALVEQGEARGEQLAVDHALRKATSDAEAHSLGKFGQCPVKPRLVLGLDMARAVADHDPVHLAPALLDRGTAPLDPCLPDQFCIETQPLDLEGLAFDLTDQ